MTSRVEKLEKDAAYRERLFSIKLSEYSATFDRLEVQLTSLVDWVNQKLLAIHEQANERNAVVEAQVGGMVATLAETQMDLEGKIADMDKTSRFLGQRPPRLNPRHEIMDVDETEGSEMVTGPAASMAPAAPFTLSEDQTTGDRPMAPAAPPPSAPDAPGSEPSPAPILMAVATPAEVATVAVGAVVAQAPPPLSRHSVGTAPPPLSRLDPAPPPAPSAPRLPISGQPLAAVAEETAVTPPPSQPSSDLSSPTPTPKQLSSPRARSAAEEPDEDDEEPPRRSIRQRSVVPTEAADSVPRLPVKRARAGSKKPKGG